MKVLKEEGLDLSRAPKDKFEKALSIYYEDLVESLVEALRKALAKAEKLPKTDRPLPIVLSGGTAKPRGFSELFEKTLRSQAPAHRSRRGPHGQGSPHRHRAGSPDRRDVREVAGSRSVHVPQPVARRPDSAGPAPSSSSPSPSRRARLAAREWYDYYLYARDRLIPAGQLRGSVQELDAAIRMKPAPALNEQTYGLQFIDYLPYYQRGRCRLKDGGLHARPRRLQDGGGARSRSRSPATSTRTSLRLRAEAISRGASAGDARARGEDAQRLLREAADLVRRQSYEEALTRLAQAEVAAKGLDPDLLRAGHGGA